MSLYKPIEINAINTGRKAVSKLMHNGDIMYNVFDTMLKIYPSLAPELCKQPMLARIAARDTNAIPIFIANSKIASAAINDEAVNYGYVADNYGSYAAQWDLTNVASANYISIYPIEPALIWSKLDKIYIYYGVQKSLVIHIGNVDQNNYFIERYSVTVTIEAGFEHDMTDYNIGLKKGEIIAISVLEFGNGAVTSDVIEGQSRLSRIDGTTFAVTQRADGKDGIFYYTLKYDPMLTESSSGDTKEDDNTDDSEETKSITFQNVLCIGNSITRHPLRSYWWGSWGMAASTEENDWVHKLRSKIRTTSETCECYAINVAASFERGTTTDIDSIISTEQSGDNCMSFSSLDVSTCDLAIIRLGENVTDTSTFSDRLTSLVTSLKAKNNAMKIVITGMFWSNDTKEEILKSVAEAQGCTYVKISQYGNSTYEETLGNQVYGDDGELHTIDNSGVAQHPSDKGMEAIAEEIYESL